MAEPKKKLIHKLKNKYRLVIINDGSFEEKFSYSLSPMNVFIGFSSFLVFFTTIIIMLIVLTPVREFIPGYTDSNVKKDLTRLIIQTDSLQKALHDKDLYYKNTLYPDWCFCSADRYFLLPVHFCYKGKHRQGSTGCLNFICTYWA
jgi:hypothetical protein